MTSLVQWLAPADGHGIAKHGRCTVFIRCIFQKSARNLSKMWPRQVQEPPRSFIVQKQGPAHTKKPPWGAMALRVVWTMKRIDYRLSPGGMKATLALADDEVGRLFHNPIQLGIQLGQVLDAQLVRQYAARHHMGHLA